MFRSQSKTSKSLTLKGTKSSVTSLDKVEEDEEEEEEEEDIFSTSLSTSFFNILGSKVKDEANEEINQNGINNDGLDGDYNDENSVLCSSMNKKNVQRLQETIVSLFGKRKPLLSPGELNSIHQLVKHMLSSQAGPLLFSYLERHILPEGMKTFVKRLNKLDSKMSYVKKLCQIWDEFYTQILPVLNCAFYILRHKQNTNVRKIGLLAFRDEVFLRPDIENKLKETVTYLDSDSLASMKQMVLVLHNTSDGMTPSKNRLRLEKLVPLFHSPFLGFRGLYVNSVLTVKAAEHLIAPRKSIDYRRISRPLSVQPKQVETLNELFLQAIKKKH